MSTFLYKSSSTADVVVWLRENTFDDEVINNFEGINYLFNFVSIVI